MRRIAIDYECPSPEWWEAGGRDLWDSLIDGFGETSVVLDDGVAESILAQAAVYRAGRGAERSTPPIRCASSRPRKTSSPIAGRRARPLRLSRDRLRLVAPARAAITAATAALDLLQLEDRVDQIERARAHQVRVHERLAEHANPIRVGRYGDHRGLRHLESSRLGWRAGGRNRRPVCDPVGGASDERWARRSCAAACCDSAAAALRVGCSARAIVPRLRGPI